MTDKNYALGAGTVYITLGDTMPTNDAEIETEANKISDTSGGATLSYSFDTYEVENDNFETLDIVKQKEKVTFKANLLTWNPEQLAMFTANSTATEKDGIITLNIGSKSKSLQHIVMRFVNELSDGSILRVTLRGVSTGGFELAFAKDKETIIPVEITALADSNGVKSVLTFTPKTPK